MGKESSCTGALLTLLSATAQLCGTGQGRTKPPTRSPGKQLGDLPWVTADDGSATMVGTHLTSTGSMTVWGLRSVRRVTQAAVKNEEEQICFFWVEVLGSWWGSEAKTQAHWVMSISRTSTAAKPRDLSISCVGLLASHRTLGPNLTKMIFRKNPHLYVVLQLPGPSYIFSQGTVTISFKLKVAFSEKDRHIWQIKKQIQS